MFHVLVVFAACLAGAVSPALAQAPPASAFGITDNSFLIEEAFNQERGIFQNIFVMSRGRDGQWDGSFTQEWPLPSERHQLSFTLPFSAVSGTFGLGDLAINYRLQALSGSGRIPAFSPRVTLLAPTSADRRSPQGGGIGWQVNLPFSVEAGRMFYHANAGATWLPMREGASPRRWAHAPFAGASAIAAVTPMLNLLIESLVVWDRAPGTSNTSVTVAPGVRAGWNLGDRQVVVGLGVPMTRGDRQDTAVLAYFSYELPFLRQP